MSPAVLGHTSKLICLPFGNEQFVGKKITVSGWGLIHPFKNIASSALISVDITGFPSKDCAILAPPVYVIDPQAHLCAGMGENRGTLNGDSGGKRYLLEHNILLLQMVQLCFTIELAFTSDHTRLSISAYVVKSNKIRNYFRWYHCDLLSS